MTQTQPNPYMTQAYNTAPGYATQHGYAPGHYAPMQTVAPQTGTQYVYTKRRQSIKVHLILAFTTAGLGNVLYALWANSKAASRYEW